MWLVFSSLFSIKISPLLVDVGTLLNHVKSCIPWLCGDCLLVVDLIHFRFRCRVFNSVFLCCLIGDRTSTVPEYPKYQYLIQVCFTLEVYLLHIIFNYIDLSFSSLQLSITNFRFSVERNTVSSVWWDLAKLHFHIILPPLSPLYFIINNVLPFSTLLCTWYSRGSNFCVQVWGDHDIMCHLPD